ncbi:hypothetical protein HDU96_009963 [Phlyctochytrium bullatum]|nr:hypothetical protein HDU96_009963 [Phlyctochytrium bullatum]
MLDILLFSFLLRERFKQGLKSSIWKNFRQWLEGPAWELNQRAEEVAKLDKAACIPKEIKQTGRKIELRRLVSAFHKALGDKEMRMNFEFEDLGLKLSNGKKVLESVTGAIRAKRMTAILGPSGAGKTTFMNVLMGKVERTSGKLLVNGKETEIFHYRKIIGYVPQDDVMLRELSVRDNIRHAARIRLPKSWTAGQIEAYVDNVLRALSLSEVADIAIGDETQRGISGGQRKRVNIGMELAAAPLALFLDEPTSGLDSTAALEVADILRSLAELGLTVISVIHQPRVEIFEKFNDVVLIIPGGRVAYLGPVNQAQRYFETLGFEFDPEANLADVLIDILSGKGKNDRYPFSPNQLADAWENTDLRLDVLCHEITDDLPVPWTVDARNSAANAFNDSPSRSGFCSDILDTAVGDPWAVSGLMRSPSARSCESKSLRSVIRPSSATLANSFIESLSRGDFPCDPNGITSADADNCRQKDLEFHRLAPQVVADRGSSFLTQIVHCHNRAVLQQSKVISGLFLELFVSMFAGCLMGLAGKADEQFSGVYKGSYVALSAAPFEVVSLYGLLLGLAVALAGAPSGVKVFSEEQPVYWREAAAGHSRLAYFIGKTVGTIYKILLSSLHFTCAYLLLAKPVLTTGQMYSLVLVQFWGVYGMACVFSMLVRRENASVIAVLGGLFAAVLCGYGPSVAQAKNWNLVWLFELSFNKWTAEAHYAMATQIYHDLYDVERAAAFFGYSVNQAGLDLLMALLLGFVWRFVGFLLLVGLNRAKQR